MEEFINFLNQNKYFYAVMMIFLNIGAKYIEIDLQDNHKKFLSSTAIRRIMIFTVAFIATRDVVISLIITACFVIIVLNLFNTTSQYCILPKQFCELDKDNNGNISPAEIKKAYDILKKAGKIE